MKQFLHFIKQQKARVALVCLTLFGLLTAGQSWGQTNNYFGTSGTLTSSVWSTNVGGPYTSALNTTGGAIINFNNIVTAFTGGSITVAGINATASTAPMSATGTITNLSNGIITINVGTSTATILDFGSQSFTSSGTAGYIKTGVGAVAMAGNTYGGGFTLNAGTIILRGTNALGSGGALNLNGGTIAGSANRDLSAKYAGGITIGGNVQFGEVTGNITPASGSSNLTFSNNMSIGSALRTLTLGGSGTITFGGVISNTGSNGLTFTANGNGTGRFEITGTNTLSGPININGVGDNIGVAEVRFTSDGSIGNAANSITIDGGRFGIVSAGTVTIANARSIAVGASSGTSITAPGNGILTYNGVISDKSGSTGILVKQGSGILSLGGVSTYTGNTAINNGTIQLTTGNNRLPTTTSLSLGQAASTNLGILDLNGRNQQVAGLNSTTGTNATASNNTITSAAAATLTINGAGSFGDGTDANSGVITGAISLVKSGAGTLTFGDVNTYTGTTSVSGGSLVITRTSTVTYTSTITSSGLSVSFASAPAIGNYTILTGALSGTSTLNSVTGLAGGQTATFNAATGVLTVSATPTVNLSVTANAGTEAGATVITVTATSSSAVSGDQTVSLAVSGTNITAGDYSLSSSTITILNGQTTGSVTFTVQDDAVVEGTETATLTISGPSSGITLGATTTQNISITDNDFPSVDLSVSANTGTEAGASAITVTATASAAVSGDQTVSLGVSGTNITAGDYTLSNTIITIPGGQTTGSVTFTVVDDAVIEGTETATLTISSPSSGITLGATTSQNIAITDNDIASVLTFVRADTTVLESAGTGKVFMRVTTAGNVAGSVDLSVSTYSTATGSGTDYSVPVTLNIPANAIVGQLLSFDFTINDDGTAEADEYVICKTINPVNTSVSGTTQSTLYIRDNDKTAPVATNQISLSYLGSYSNGASGTNSAEISAYDSASKRIFIANSIANKLDIVNFANPATPVLISSINLGVAPFNGAINSVDVFNGTVALALEGLTDKQANGKVVFTDFNGTYISEAAAGAMPDMITFNHAGTKVYTANEGEPNTAYTNDPVGSITVVDISGGVASASSTNILFTAYNGQETTLRSQGIRIYGVTQPGSVPSTASQDFEPEYITVSDDDSKAWVTLQENNALVELNLTNNTIVKLIPLGFKDHSNVNNPMDVSDQTFGINLSNFNVKGMYEPDAVAHYTSGGNLYLLTANEGDSRAYTGFSEETRVSALTLDPTAYPNSADIKNNAVLGRLTVTNKLGDTDNDGDIDQIYSLGSRSFSIWDPTAVTPLVYDSKDDMERITSTSPTYSQYFNMSNTIANTAVKNRSDDKGPEPEGVTVGKIGGKTYAFVGIERIGGVFVYDITNPLSPAYVTYANSRTIAGGDRGAEGIVFIPASQSPNGKNLVILSNEISSTLSVFEIAACDATNTFSGTGDWTDGSKWSCLAPPATNTNVEVIIAPGANATLNTDFIVAGSLQLNATSTLTINANQTLSISGTANFNSQSVTLRSNATCTASLGQITGTLNGASKVTVERYLPINTTSGRTGKAWRLLTAPVTGTTVNAAWQGGSTWNGVTALPATGYNTLITGGVYASSASANAQGFDWWDAIKNATSSIRTHNGLGAGAWLTPANTTSLNFVNNQGYLLYVRGDRSVSTGAANATTLRATGTLKQGGFTPAIIPNGTATFTLIGNPYASPINFETIYQNNSSKILPRFTIFDANLGLSGGYYLVERVNATSYNITPKPSGSANSSATAQFIQSSQAIFVEASTNTANTLSIAETDKASGGNASVFLQNGGGSADQSVAKGRTSAASLNINLNIKNADNSILLADGAVVRISAAYNKAVTSEDATKTNNIAENLAIGVDNYNLISERRPTLGKTDTVFLKLWGTGIKNYQLEISGTNLKGRTASLIDSYLGTATALNLDGSSNIINFSISSDAASKAINRFYIVTPGSAVTALKTGTLNEQSATTNAGAVSMKAYPNPATGKMVSVLITNIAKGSYSLSAFSSKGQQLFTRTLQHTGGNLTQDIALNNWSTGVYSLQLIDANGAIVKTTSIIVGQ